MTTEVPSLPPYRRRVVDLELDALLGGLPAISLEGPKGVGKTATAARRAQTTHRLDDPAQLEIIRGKSHRLVSGAEPILIDEWQRYPPSWDLVRRAVDDSPRPGRFLLTGSASPPPRSTHSGAGRIVRLRMWPLTLPERGVDQPTVSLASLLAGGRPEIDGTTEVDLDTYVTEMLAGGFPALRLPSESARRRALDGYLHRITDTDLPELGVDVRRPATLRRWLTAYAAATATTASYEKIRDAATAGSADKPAKSTTIPFRDALERIWILDSLPAWAPTNSRINRLVLAPKHHLVDPALAARLVGVDAEALLTGRGPSSIPRDGTFLGALFESLVVMTARVFAQAAEARVSHFRTKSAEHEVDVIVERGNGRIVALEAKLSATVEDRDVRHLRWLRDQIGDDLLDAVVITTGKYAYRRQDGIAVVPLALLGP